MTRLELLDSARHKLQLAGYHGRELLRILELHPTENLEDDRRIAMEAHLEGLAYHGTAAAEKTLRSIDPKSLRQLSIGWMLGSVKADARPPAVREFGSAFERWWEAEGQFAQVARDLRNDAAHRVYEKAPDGPLWRMEIAGQRIPLRQFAERYGAHLTVLTDLVEQAEGLAAARAG